MEPDLIFVRKNRLGVISERGVEGPPDLLVEILSPSTAARDRGVKLERYRHFGVAEYWIVDPESRTVEVWDLKGGRTEATVLGPGGVLAWAPGRGDVTLEIDLEEVLGPV
jgi:Uma2 family endonuclease